MRQGHIFRTKHIFLTKTNVALKKLACGSQPGTFLHSFIVDFHVHHGGRAVPQDFPVAAVLLVTGSYLVSSLVRPPQLLS